MKTTNALATADALSDQDLLVRLDHLAFHERETVAELVAHLAALDERRSLYVAKGYSSLFAYCRGVLHLSEDAACNRIDVARACRKFPEILERLVSGELNLTNVRLLADHLTPENCPSVLARAVGKRRREIDVLVAELDPKPDAPTFIRRVPMPQGPAASNLASPAPAPPAFVPATAPAPPPSPRPDIRPTAPERYRVQFTVCQETHDKLRRLQDLLRREIPNGDPATIVDRALTLLLEKVERAKEGAAAKPRPTSPVRSGTDTPASRPSRHIPRAVVREVYRRDDRQCAFVSTDGHRCSERVFLEKHHVLAYAEDGPATVENIVLHCSSHNQYEAERIFGPRTPPGSLGEEAWTAVQETDPRSPIDSLI
jgi:hypothetical protein